MTLDELEDAGARELVVHVEGETEPRYRILLGAVCVVHGPVYGSDKAKHRCCWSLRSLKADGEKNA